MRVRGLAHVIDLRQLAIGNQTGEADFYEVLESSGRSGLRDSAPPNFSRQLTRVQCVRLQDDISAEEAARVKFIKLDLEGGDFDALQGGVDILVASRSNVVFEFTRAMCAEQYGFSRDEFFEFFRKINYDIFCNLGLKFTPGDWDIESAYMSADFFAFPAESAESTLSIIGPKQKFLIEELKQNS